MRFIADLHIHAHYSMATSKQLTPEFLDKWGRIKGIKLIGTGDFTHPGWTAELKEKLEPAEPGFFKLKEAFKQPAFVPETPENSVRFVLTAEISNIYKKQGKVRKVHNVLLAPGFKEVEDLQRKLQAREFNITSDGRPILGLDAKALLEMCLEVSPEMVFIPAHIWTPWFSVLGSKSGFNTIEACFEDLSSHIHALETGLSTDPAMNWMCSILDNYNLISNSDAHSPEKLGRNATLFDTSLSYKGLKEALEDRQSGKLAGTFDMFPQEGKYHYDGHRKCGICWSPLDTLQHGGICPECGKKVTVGVTHRVVELSDRADILERPNRKPFYSIIPLKEMLAEMEQVGENSKRIARLYETHVAKAGSEYQLLHYMPVEAIREQHGDALAEAIRRMRNHEVFIQEGYDGEYGKIQVFRPEERVSFSNNGTLFYDNESRPEPPHHKYINFDMAGYLQLRAQGQSLDTLSEKQVGYMAKSHEKGLLVGLNPEQQKAVQHFDGPALTLAGPGTGKTGVLTRRIAYLIQKHKVAPSKILAVTFTNQAAQEMQERVSKLTQLKEQRPFISTFHKLGFELLSQFAEKAGLNPGFSLLNEDDKVFVVGQIADLSNAETKCFLQYVSQRKDADACVDDERFGTLFDVYEAYLKENNLLDLDDLIYRPVLLLRKDQQVLADCQKRWPWILVDEYQDINACQYELLKLLVSSEQPNIFAIGDPQQSIYGFRGSSQLYIEQFAHDFPARSLFQLKTSYRCSQTILQASGNVLQSDAPLEALEAGVEVKISAHPTEKSEAEYIAREIEKLSGGLRFFSMDSKISQGESHEAISSLADFAVLCRTRAQMEALKKAFVDHSIPYQAVPAGSFWEDRQVLQLLDGLRWQQNPDNAFLQAKLTRQLNCTAEELAEIFPKPQGLLAAYMKQCMGRMPAVDGERLEALDAFICWLEGQQLSEEALLQYALLGRPGDDYEAQNERVTLMTLHASKGLEFACVFIAGCEQGLLPYKLYPGQSCDEEEERRLLYVGMTRAKRLLYFTHAAKRIHKGRRFELPRSSFLLRIEKHLLKQVAHEYKNNRKDDSQLALF